MKELYESLRKMFVENQKEVMDKKEALNKRGKAFVRENREYMRQLTNYGEELERNISTINKRLQHLIIED